MVLRSILRSLPPSLKRPVKNILRTVRGRWQPSAVKPPAPRRETEQGQVTSVTPTEIVGTLNVPADGEPIHVRLVVDDLEVDQVAVPASDGTSHWRFPVKGLWRFCRPEDRIMIRVGDICLTMPDGSDHYSPPSVGAEPLTVLKQRLVAGEIMNSQGVLTLPKYLDTEWQRSVTAIHRQVHEAVLEITGHESFLIYGSLLGAVREGRPLGHDLDFDSAYLSEHTDPALVTAEAGELALELQRLGFSVEARGTCMHISDPARTQRIDLYHLYFDDNDELRLAWGAVSTTPFRRDQWQGTEETRFAGASVLIPRNAEALLEVLYGPHWRIPKPGFDWPSERTTRAPEANFPFELRPIINWQDHWMHTAVDASSSFARFVADMPLDPALVIDLGCGDGADAATFVRSGAFVLGLDRAPAAIGSAQGRRLSLDHAGFVACDITESSALRTAVEAHGENKTPRLFYARQFLDCITEADRAALFSDLSDLIRPGDSIALEFRGLKDATLTGHEIRNCGRNLVDAGAVRTWLRTTGFDILVDGEGDRWERRRSKGIHLHRLVGVKTPDAPVGAVP